MLKPLLPWTVHESQRSCVAPRDSEEAGPEPVDFVPVEEDGPESLHPGRPVVAQQEERDEETAQQHGQEQPLG